MAQLSAAEELASYSPSSRVRRPSSRAEALAYCRTLARTHYENFTVASWFLPRRLLPHFYAIYAFCREADDAADEAADTARRWAALDAWHEQLTRCYAGSAEHPVFVALRSTIEEFSIPPEPFQRLLVAFRQDQRVARYATHDDVLGYCRNSANPVGHLVLYLGRCHEPRLAALSDSICTGLQLANFCQDVARDWAKGRVYLPQDTLAAAGVTQETFERGRHDDAFDRAMRVEVDRALAYLRAGEPLVELVPAELRVDVALFHSGGLAILQAIRDLNYDVWRKRPTISRPRQLRLLWQCFWRTRFQRKEARR